MKVPYLSVVVPAYNEADNYRDGRLDPIWPFLKKQKYSWEVVFVNDGSTDDTKKLLEKLCRLKTGARILNISHGGKAAAVTAGMLAARGEVILFTDFDQSTPLHQVEKYIAAHKNEADVVIGDRGILGMSNKPLRRFRSWVFVTLVNIVLLPGVRDSQCGFKSFTKKAAKQIFSSLKVSKTGKVTGGYMGAFDVEALFLANKWGYKIAQVPVEWDKVEGVRLNPWLEPLKMIRDVFKVRLFDLLGKYDHLANTAKA